MDRRAALLSLAGLAAGAAAGAQETRFAFETGTGRMRLLLDGREIGTYVYQDPRIPRPYFHHLRSSDGIQVTRSNPPVAGQDPTDHDLFHPGLWLAFGDLGGADNWRAKAPVRHAGFPAQPRARGAGAGFSVRNEYLAEDGRRVVCREEARYTLLARPAGWLLVSDSRFMADAETWFGDQEEMGLGVRVATPISGAKGGTIASSDGLTGEKQVWGKQADWCDYSGAVNGRRVGVTLMPDPANFGRSWFHVREYGLMVANPFGRKAFTNGEPSRVPLQPGRTLRLRFGVLIHSAPPGQPVDLRSEYQVFRAIPS